MSKLHPLSAFQALQGKYPAQIKWKSDEKPRKKPARATNVNTTGSNKDDPGVNQFNKVKPDYMGKSLYFFPSKPV